MTDTVNQPTLLDVVRRCLGDESIDWDDNFYAVGGDSILALRVITLAAEVGLDLDVLDLLTRDSLGDVAVSRVAGRPEQAHETGPNGPRTSEPAGVPAGAEAVWPASALQVGLIYLAELGSESGAYLDFVGVRLLAPFDEPALRASLDELMRRHPTLRSSFDLATFSTAVQVAWNRVEAPLIVQPATRDNEHDLLAAWREAVLDRGIDWERAPGWRCHALVSDGHFRLSLAIHHSFVDGWSYARLLVDLLTCYDARLRGVAAVLPSPPQRGHERFVELEREAAAPGPSERFWADQMRLLSPVVGWDARRTPDPREVVTYPIPTDLWRRLTSFANTLRVPVKSLCLAAHARALGQWHGRDQIVTGCVMNGRPDVPGADLLVGLFLNTVPIRLPTRGDWRELSLAASDAERAVTPHRRFPLSRIEATLGGPAFDISFNFTHFHVLRELDALPVVRIDSWWSRDRATFPMLADFYVDDPEGGTGVALTFDPDLVAVRRATDLLALMEDALHDMGVAHEAQTRRP